MTLLQPKGSVFPKDKSQTAIPSSVESFQWGTVSLTGRGSCDRPMLPGGAFVVQDCAPSMGSRAAQLLPPSSRSLFFSIPGPGLRELSSSLKAASSLCSFLLSCKMHHQLNQDAQNNSSNNKKLLPFWLAKSSIRAHTVCITYVIPGKITHLYLLWRLPDDYLVSFAPTIFNTLRVQSHVCFCAFFNPRN